MTALALRDRMLGEGDPAIIAPLIGTDVLTLAREARSAADAGVDIVEWRLDLFLDVLGRQAYRAADERLTARRIVEAVSPAAEAIRDALNGLPLLVTVRTASEGGRLEIDRTDYGHLVAALVDTGWAQALDVEALSHPGLVADLSASMTSHQVALIASHHRFDTTPTPADLDRVLQQLADSGADVVKLAVMPTQPQHVLDLMLATRRAADALPVPVITMSMGPLGSLSRLAGSVTGSVATFATLGGLSAPGQLPVDLVRQVQEVMR